MDFKDDLISLFNARISCTIIWHNFWRKDRKLSPIIQLVLDPMAQARFHLYNEFIWPMATSILFYITLAILTFMPLFFVSVWNINSSYECVIFYKLPSYYVFENLKIIFDFVFSEDMFLINKISDIYSIISICLIHVIFVLKNFPIFPNS